MFKINETIKSLYAINLIEGEGIGTAYEYYVKLRKLRKFINSIERPQKILIAGLPEKYGLSMDFFLLGQMLQAEIVVIDERIHILERAQKAIWTLKSKKVFDDIKVNFLKVDQLSEFNNKILIEEKFNLALCSEVIQRLDRTQKTYISNLKKSAEHFAIFVPNRGNESHANLSGLKSIYLGELLKYCQEGYPKITLYDYGYIDMPPFPPGLSRSKEKRDQAAKSRLEAFLMKGLEIYSLCENVIPNQLKEKIAHIVYVLAENHQSL
jgi:hypothetical protein